MKKGIVKNICRSPKHTMSKANQDSIMLLKGLGVAGDAHMGEKVKHRSRVRQNPDQPNLRQVHLIHSELHDDLAKKGFEVSAGQMGENITTQGLELLTLPKDTILKIGPSAQIQVTGLRNPCVQLDGIQPGLMQAVLDKDAQGNLVRKAGIMGIVLEGGAIVVGDQIEVVYPPPPFIALERV